MTTQSTSTPITRDELAAAIKEGDVSIVDALPATYYDNQHLPGAVNLVLADVDEQAESLLPDKDARIVTYCTGPTCQNSTQVATRLSELGYTNVRKYADGIDDWTAAGLPTEHTQS